MHGQRIAGTVCLLVFSVLFVGRADAAAKVSFCGQANSCVCVEWETASSTWIEVRCPSPTDSGWTDDPTGKTIDEPDGSWDGGGGEQPTDNPGSPLGGSLLFAWNKAFSIADKKLRGDSNCCLENGKPYYTPNQCTQLFSSNPMGRTGHYLLTEYINPRAGDGVRGPAGDIPCNSGNVSVWTTCCLHDPDVFVCSRFENQPSTYGAALIIHEVLHVAGQAEDSVPGYGPDNPPSPAEITAAVREACGL